MVWQDLLKGCLCGRIGLAMRLKACQRRPKLKSDGYFHCEGIARPPDHLKLRPAELDTGTGIVNITRKKGVKETSLEATLKTSLQLLYLL